MNTFILQPIITEMNTSKKSKKKTFTFFSLFRKRGKGPEGLSQMFTHLNLDPQQYQYTGKAK